MSLPQQRPRSHRVRVVVTDDEHCREAVAAAAREALRHEVPLELALPRPSRRAPVDGAERARLAQRLDHAVGVARSAAPGVDVRVASGTVSASH